MRIRSDLGWRLVGFLGRVLLSFIAVTSRVQIIGRETIQELRKKKKPMIHLVWHGRIFLAPYFFRRQEIMPLISPSEDGEIVARIVEGWGYKILRGSSSHSMVTAWKEMVQELRRGGEIIIVPDGPRGPNRVLKIGALKLAKETGAVLVPFSFSSSRRRFLRSWDHFLLTWPFSRIVAIHGEPIPVFPDLSEEELEEKRQEVEKILCGLDATADQLVAEKA